MIAKYLFLALILIGALFTIQDKNVAWALGLLGLIILYTLEFSSPT